MQFDNFLLLIAVIISAGFLTINDQRWRIAMLAMIQLISFILILQIWPIALASIKLISGWMGSLLLGYSLFLFPRDDQKSSSTSSNYFRILIIVVIFVFLMVNVGLIAEWLPVEYNYLFIGLIFLFSGLVGFSLLKNTFEAFLSLLVFFTGFDIIYSSLEGSALVTGIYALIIVFASVMGVLVRSYETDME